MNQTLPQKTLVFQSHRRNLPYAWLEECLDSVQQWVSLNNYAYAYLDDELFSLVDDSLMERYKNQKVILTDLARLLWIRKYLDEGFQRVVWLDADFLVFNAGRFQLMESDYAVGREVWLQSTQAKGIKIYKKVHNAFLMFTRGNAFLNFYIESAIRLLTTNTGNVPPQFIGPKFLTALHNICLLPVQESAGMLSPLLINAIAEKNHEVLELFENANTYPVYAANMSSSVINQAGMSDKAIHQLIDQLMVEGLTVKGQGQ